MEWWGEGRPAFVDPRGNTHFEGGWEPSVSGAGHSGDVEHSGGVDRDGATSAGELDRVAELVRANRLAGSRPDGWSACARWKTEDQIPDDVLFAALEAIA